MDEPTCSFSPNKGAKGNPEAPVGKVRSPGLSYLGGRLSLAQGQRYLKGQLALLYHRSRRGTSMKNTQRVPCTCSRVRRLLFCFFMASGPFPITSSHRQLWNEVPPVICFRGVHGPHCLFSEGL